MGLSKKLNISRPSILFLSLASGQNFADKLIGSIFVIFLTSNHMSSTQIGILLALSTWVTGILDFPTGNISDIKGRKKTTIFGFLAFGIGLIIYGSGSHFWHFAVAQCVMGLGIAFISGAIVAWYIDALRSIGQEKESKRVFALSNGFSYFFNTIAGLVAAFLVIYSMRLPFWVGGIMACSVALICSLFMEENYGDKDQKYTVFLKNTWNSFAENNRIKLFTLIEIIAGISFIYFILSWQPYLTSKGLSTELLGVIYTVMMLSISLTGFILSKFINDENCPNIAIFSMLLMALAFILMYISNTLIMAVLSCILFQIALSIKMSSFMAWINDIIPNRSRASMLSTISTFVNIGNAVMFAFIGYLIDKIGLQPGLIFAFVASLVAALIFMNLKHVSKKINAELSKVEA